MKRGPPPDAPCREHDRPELWFAKRTADRQQAVLLCRGCPTRELCIAARWPVVNAGVSGELIFRG